MDEQKQERFVAAFFAGLAAPVGLYSSPPDYPVYVAASSVPAAFAGVGVSLSAATSRYRDDASRDKPTDS
jgi:hypothetical protein